MFIELIILIMVVYILGCATCLSINFVCIVKLFYTFAEPFWPHIYHMAM